MAQPTGYSRQYDFTGFSSNYPSDQQPGVQIDAEFNAVKTTLDGTLTNLALIQRDDGRLANASVSLEQVTTDLIAYFSASSLWTIRGAWLTTTVYAVNNVVTYSGSTYICVTAHTSGTFATDLAAGKWVTIYGSTTTVVPDNAVTTAKIADGAVTLPKIGFTSLDLTSTIRAQGGLAAGTETAGTYLSGVKNASGDAYQSVARTTQAQGNVGVRIGGGTSGTDWFWRQGASSNLLALYNTTLAANAVAFDTTGMSDFAYTQRITGAGTPATGAGVETQYSASVGYVQAYDRGAAAWKDIKVRGANTYLSAAGVDVVKATSSAAQIIDGYGAFQDAGYKGLPVTTKTGAYTLAIADQGTMISITTGGIVIPANGSVAIPVGATIVIFNNSGSNQTISITTDTLRLAGTATTGSVTLAQYGFATLVKVASTTWVASGNVS
ncbi:MAG: hypothetical protein K2Q27_01160 [Novosphingobium sp.]|nr:hypothetical protein [Novosphingobium sp.]